jgi:hypothetical protein
MPPIGNRIGGTLADNRSMPHAAITRPSDPPVMESRVLSIRTCRSRCQRVAPTACRIANSRER